jgi:hypothetical protein
MIMFVCKEHENFYKTMTFFYFFLSNVLEKWPELEPKFFDKLESEPHKKRSQHCLKVL